MKILYLCQNCMVFLDINRKRVNGLINDVIFLIENNNLELKHELLEAVSNSKDLTHMRTKIEEIFEKRNIELREFSSE